MGSFSVSVALELQGHSLSKEAFPNLAHAVEQVTASVQEEWQSYARGAPLPSGRSIANRTGEYLRSILLRTTGDFTGEVYSELPFALAIEEGSPARDMKKILDTSLKVRTTKTGKRYLIIPFRWNVPGSVLGHNMPEAVHDWWQDPARKRSVITGTYRRVSGTGAFDIKTRQLITVPGWRYNWGHRLQREDLTKLGVGGKAAKNMAGMVNFRAAGAAGGAAGSKYINFRVMMEGSKGWIAPARDGLFPAKTAGEHHQAVAEQLFKAAVEQDVKALLTDGGLDAS